MIDGLIAGKLHGAPEPRRDKADKPFAVAKVLAHNSDGEGFIVNVIAFDAQVCATLLAMDEGDAVALAGHLTPIVWTDKHEQARPALDMVAQQVLTAYQLTRKHKAVSTPGG